MKKLGVLLSILLMASPLMAITTLLDLNDYQLVDGTYANIDLTPWSIPGSTGGDLDNVSVISAAYVSTTDSDSYVYLYQVINSNKTHELHRVTLTEFEGVAGATIGYLSDAPDFVSGGIDPVGYDINAGTETLGFEVIFAPGTNSSVIYITSDLPPLAMTTILAQNGGQAYGSVVAPSSIVPEPATMALLGLGALLIRKRK